MTGNKVIVAGSRSIKDGAVVREAMQDCRYIHGEPDEIVHGCAAGVDSLAGAIAKDMRIDVARFPPNWDKHGKKAGPIRNEDMAQYADALIAVWDGESRGTKHMIDTALDYGLDVYVHVVDNDG